MERKYIAFISYRHAELDSAVAKQLHTLIEQYSIPKKLRKNGKRLGLVFRDQEELPISSNLSDDICRALDNSQYLIVVCSKNTAQSPWVGREIDYFLSHHDQQHTLAVLASGEPQDVFPKALTIRSLADGTVEEVEPLAVDVRAESMHAMKRKLRHEVKRLYAALIGCPYDALVMREHRRKQRRLAAVMGLCMAVLGSFTAMTIAKNLQIDQKNEELAGMNQALEGKNLELEDKNAELARQKAQVQQRESELLTEKGFAAIAENDTQAAIENFVSALPNAQEDRPYYALAEQGLISALEIMDADRDPLKAFGHTLEQSTPIDSYEISADGTKIMTIDEYGLLTCFRCNDGAVLWTRRLPKDDFIQTVAYPEEDAVLISIGETICSVEFGSGELLWEHTAPAGRKIYLSPNRETLVYYGQTATDDLEILGTYLTVLSAKTGEVVHDIKTPVGDIPEEEKKIYLWTFPEMIAGDSCINGAFSSDGTRFAYTYNHHDADGYGSDHCVVVDLRAGDSKDIILRKRNIYSGSSLSQIHFSMDDSALLCIGMGKSTSQAASAELIDIATGRLLWEVETEPVEGKIFSDTHPVYAAVSDTELFIGRGWMLYYLDISSGKLLASYELPSSLLHMDWVGPDVFSVFLEDGRYTLALGNDQGIHLLDYYFSTYVSFGPASDIRLWEKGPLRVHKEGDRITGLTSEDKNAGFAAIIPADSTRTIKIKRIVSFRDLIQFRTVDEESLESAYLVHNLAHTAPQGKVFLCRTNYDYADGSTFDTYYLVDTATGEMKAFDTQRHFDAKDFWITSDAAGYIITDEAADMIYVDIVTGEQRILWENPEQKACFSGTVLERTGQVLTAALGQNFLRYWLDGKEEAQIPVPGELCLVLEEAGSQYCFMKAVGEGYLVCSLFDPEGDAQLCGLAAYDIFENKWYAFADEWDDDSQFASLAKEHPWAAYNVSGNTIVVQDMTTGASIARLAIDLDPNSLESLNFCAGDRYIVAETMDRQVFLYALETGALMGTYQLEEIADGVLQIAADPAGKRLYLWYAASTDCPGICLDMESWSKLTDIPGMLYYDTEQDQICSYIDFTRKWAKQLHFFRLPSTAELVKIGEMLLAH